MVQFDLEELRELHALLEEVLQGELFGQMRSERQYQRLPGNAAENSQCSGIGWI